MAKRALVTGGAGFVGSHLCDVLLREGHHVTILDNLSTGSYNNIMHLEGRPDVALIVDTVSNEKLVEELIRSVDCVYHLASSVGVKLIMERPVQTIENIFGCTDVVLRQCSRYRKRVLITSTSEVYGKGVSVPFREDDDVLTGATSKNRWAYACAKALDEFLALAYWNENRLPVAVVRLFNTVGPRQTGQYGMVLPRFIRSALANESLVVHGDGSQSRCFGHVLDIVEALSRTLRVSGCFGQVMNLGNDQEVSILELAQRIIRLTNSASKVQLIPYTEAYGEGFEDMRRRVPCLDKARRLIDYKPRHDLDAIIMDTIQSMK